MAYAIITMDKPGSLEKRMAARDEHLSYLDSHAAHLLAAGAQISDDGTGGHGGVIIYDTDDRAVAQAFIDGDPFTKAGLFESIIVTRWRKAFFDGKRLV